MSQFLPSILRVHPCQQMGRSSSFRRYAPRLRELASHLGWLRRRGADDCVACSRTSGCLRPRRYLSSVWKRCSPAGCDTGHGDPRSSSHRMVCLHFPKTLRRVKQRTSRRTRTVPIRRTTVAIRKLSWRRSKKHDDPRVNLQSTRQIVYEIN